MVCLNNGSMNDLKTSLLRSNASARTGEEKYFTFANPKINRSLHVIDADYGVFDSDRQSKNKNFRMRTPRFIRKFTEKEPDDVNNCVILDDDDDLKLRPEPELVASHTSPARFNNTTVMSRNLSSSRLPSGYELDSDDGYSSSSDLECAEYRSSKPKSKYDRSHTGEGIKSLSSQLLKGLRKESAQPAQIGEVPLEANHKSRIEMKYDLLKLRAAKYKAERNMERTKLENHKMASKLRDYEYYCVNGIDHRTIELDSENRNEYGRKIFRLEYPQRQSRRISASRSIKSSTFTQPPLQSNYFDTLSQNLSPEVAMFFNYYGEFVPSTASIREFHQAVLAWIYSVPFLSLIYPVLYMMGTMIPKHSTRSWSARALTVGFLDLCILLTTGWAIYNLLVYAVFFISQALRVAHFFRII